MKWTPFILIPLLGIHAGPLASAGESGPKEGSFEGETLGWVSQSCSISFSHLKESEPHPELPDLWSRSYYDVVVTRKERIFEFRMFQSHIGETESGLDAFALAGYDSIYLGDQEKLEISLNEMGEPTYFEIQKTSSFLGFVRKKIHTKCQLTVSNSE